MKRMIKAGSRPRPVHVYKGHKIMKITSCGIQVYHVQGMPQDFYQKYWDGEFVTLREAKKYIDKYEADGGVL